MRSVLKFAAATVVGLALSTGVAVAHHNANAVYVMDKQISIKGTLIQTRDIQPHAEWRVRVPGPNGTSQEWTMGSVSMNFLRRLGVKVKEDIRIGDTYTFYISPARGGARDGFLHSIVWSNGRRVDLVPK